MKILIQWANGSFLPVMVKKSSKSSDISFLLRFAYSPDEEITFFFNGTPLNQEDTLENQMIKEDDTLLAIISPKQNNISKKKMKRKIKSIVSEAAKVSDWHYNAMEKENRYYNNVENESTSDDDYYVTNYYFKKGKKATSVSSKPLPTFWSNNPSKNNSLLDNKISTKLNSIEEAGKFLEKHGWSSWAW